MKSALEQFMTPEWAAELIVERFYPALDHRHTVVEPSCGRGAFIKALPRECAIIGVEIDPALAAIAQVNTGRRILIGDFLETDVVAHPTHLIGNPPWRVAVVRAFLDRAFDLLPANGEVGFILPADLFQHGHTVLEIEKKWRMSVHMIPRDIWGRALRRPIVFAQFYKDLHRSHFGFALYTECEAVKRMSKEVQQILIDGKPCRTTWRALVEHVLEKFGRATLPQIYAAIEPLRHTDNQWWKEKVRQVLQIGPFIKEDEEWKRE